MMTCGVMPMRCGVAPGVQHTLMYPDLLAMAAAAGHVRVVNRVAEIREDVPVSCALSTDIL